MSNKLRHETKLTSTEETLKNFMLEMFDFGELKKSGIYSKEIKRNDYQAQADRICHYFGFKTVFEYGKDSIQCHLSYANRMLEEPFVTVIKSIYE